VGNNSISQEEVAQDREDCPEGISQVISSLQDHERGRKGLKRGLRDLVAPERATLSVEREEKGI